MKKPIFLSMALLLSLGTSLAFAQESVNETKDARSDGYVRINVVRGEIEVVGWDKTK